MSSIYMLTLIFFEVHTLTLSLDKKDICCNNGEYRQLFPTIIMPMPLEFYVSHDKIRMPPTVEHNASLSPPRIIDTEDIADAYIPALGHSMCFFFSCYNLRISIVAQFANPIP